MSSLPKEQEERNQIRQVKLIHPDSFTSYNNVALPKTNGLKQEGGGGLVPQRAAMFQPVWACEPSMMGTPVEETT